MYNDNEGMILRSGTTINSVKHSQLYKDSIKITNQVYDHEKLHNEYCSPCRTMISVLDLIETHHKEIKGEETKIHGNGRTWIKFYVTIRDKLKEFITLIDSGNRVKCYCDELDHRYAGRIYSNICYMQDLAEDSKYSSMANYKGYGKGRELYRIYHKNFFVYYEPGDGTTVIGRDFARLRDELHHWYKYFSGPHHSVAEPAKNSLAPYINDDCISVVLSFL